MSRAVVAIPREERCCAVPLLMISACTTDKAGSARDFPLSRLHLAMLVKTLLALFRGQVLSFQYWAYGACENDRASLHRVTLILPGQRTYRDRVSSAQAES